MPRGLPVGGDTDEAPLLRLGSSRVATSPIWFLDPHCSRGYPHYRDGQGPGGDGPGCRGARSERGMTFEQALGLPREHVDLQKGT